MVQGLPWVAGGISWNTVPQPVPPLYVVPNSWPLLLATRPASGNAPSVPAGKLYRVVSTGVAAPQGMSANSAPINTAIGEDFSISSEFCADARSKVNCCGTSIVPARRVLLTIRQGPSGLCGPEMAIPATAGAGVSRCRSRRSVSMRCGASRTSTLVLWKTPAGVGSGACRMLS